MAPPPDAGGRQSNSFGACRSIPEVEGASVFAKSDHNARKAIDIPPAWHGSAGPGLLCTDRFADDRSKAKRFPALCGQHWDADLRHDFDDARSLGGLPRRWRYYCAPFWTVAGVACRLGPCAFKAVMANSNRNRAAVWHRPPDWSDECGVLCLRRDAGLCCLALPDRIGPSSTDSPKGHSAYPVTNDTGFPPRIRYA